MRRLVCKRRAGVASTSVALGREARDQSRLWLNANGPHGEAPAPAIRIQYSSGPPIDIDTISDD
jgi:hypothetical protein